VPKRELRAATHLLALADVGEGFASQMWGLSILAQAELDNGDIEGAKKTLVRIAKVASERAPKTS
jgi:hypothetical protein